LPESPKRRQASWPSRRGPPVVALPSWPSRRGPPVVALPVGIATDQFQFPNLIPASTFIDGVHSISTFTGVQDDFVRLAWETDGAAWNNDIISGGSNAFQSQFDTAFMQSIGDQIECKLATGDVVFPDDPLLQINLGGPAGNNFIADTDPILGPNFLSAGTTVANTTNSILQNGNSMAGDAETLSVFQTARVMSSADMNLNIPASQIPNGTYVVELMLANIDNFDQIMDVSLKSRSARDTVLNGLRILKAPAPRVVDVRVDGRLAGSEWVPEAEVSYAQRVFEGKQLRPLFQENANTIEIQFDGPVNISSDGSELTLVQTVNVASGGVTNTTFDSSDFLFVYDPLNFIGTWTLNNPQALTLANGKYAIHLATTVTGSGGQALDGEWENDDNGDFNGSGFTNDDITPDDYTDDIGQAFLSGDGTIDIADVDLAFAQFGLGLSLVG